MPSLSKRLRRIRVDRFGEAGAPLLAMSLGLSMRAWLAYERGEVIPAQTLLAFIDRAGACPCWLMTGRGEPYASDEDSPPRMSHSARWDGSDDASS